MSNPPAQPNPGQPNQPRVQAQLIRHESSSFAGPLPPPDVLAKYEAIQPGLADRIMKLTEGEAEFRRRQGTIELTSDIEARKLYFRQVRRGQILGFLIGVCAIGAGAFMTVSGHPLAGGFFGTGGVAALVSAFLYDRYQIKNQPENKDQS